MGNNQSKPSVCVLELENQSALREKTCKIFKKQLTSTISSDVAQMKENFHCAEGNMGQIVPKEDENETWLRYEVTKTQVPRGKTSFSFQMLSLSENSGSAKSGILEEAEMAPSLNVPEEIMVEAETRATELDLKCKNQSPAQAGRLHVVGQAVGDPSEISERAPLGVPPHPCTAIEGETILEPFQREPVSVSELWKGTDIHGPVEMDDPLSNEQVAVSIVPGKAPVAAAKEQPTAQRQGGKTSSEEAPRMMAGAPPDLVMAEGHCSMETAPQTKQLAEGQHGAESDFPAAGTEPWLATETNGKVTEGCSAAENMGENKGVPDTQLKMSRTEAQQVTPRKAEDEGMAAGCVAAEIFQKSEMESTLAQQILGGTWERPNGDAKFLGAPQNDGANSCRGHDAGGISHFIGCARDCGPTSCGCCRSDHHAAWELLEQQRM
ncbi:uncharacterized protein LOC128344820 [Hemicordylus capensis]|uniref:uncharacterized protein LOC128344820 n=1 Tax=Hemicordylus capensis TaxID=884348 RepID=UPI0023023451|nr:uncharacterized protein LOC128344820 [Hemicordylus capensis]XP_053151723.1 uncharacterized protein LOC128344820 [Hemicordylus capensis]